MSNSDQTFYLGLSMAGTVSAGTYTGGTLVELNRWLSSWQKAKKDGIKLKVVKDIGNYRKGDEIEFSANEVPQHKVKIKALSGASGGGVSGALFLAGLSTGKVDEFLREIWTALDVEEMLNTSDLHEGKPIYSILNTLPIDKMMERLKKEKWDNTDHAKDLDYLDDYVELYMTLASLEGIPYKTAAASGQSLSYGIHKTHMDYIKFNFLKKGSSTHPNTPYGYNLLFRSNFNLGDDSNWHKLIQSAPATAAFPFGFKPRSLSRFRKEYEEKLFYLQYSCPPGSSYQIPYKSLKPAWLPGNADDQFDMEYVDGGTFNREPHDLARASLLKNLDIGESLPNNGKDTIASVILIDPFPTNDDELKLPGEAVTSIPSIFGLVGDLANAMTNHGRFRPDWIERTLDGKYYSRFLISPIRRDSSNQREENPLAGGLLGAFSGFLDRKYRDHDYQLGRFNSFKFYDNYFSVPSNNVVIAYDTQNSDLMEKYEAVGWIWKNDQNEQHCQIIPRTFNSDDPFANVQPSWPTMSRDKWEDLKAKATKRAKVMADTVTPLGRIGEAIVDRAIWKHFAKDKVEKGLKAIESKLKDAGLLRI